MCCGHGRSQSTEFDVKGFCSQQFLWSGAPSDVNLPLWFDIGLIRRILLEQRRQ